MHGKKTKVGLCNSGSIAWTAQLTWILCCKNSEFSALKLLLCTILSFAIPNWKAPVIQIASWTG